MINPNSLADLSYNLEDILETNVSEALLGKLTLNQRTYLTHLMYEWTQGKEVIEKIKEVLDSVKPKPRYSNIPSVKEYLIIKNQ